MSKKRTDFGESLLSNNSAYAQYLFSLAELSCAMFKWENLPATVDPRFLEITLFSDGGAIFFQDDGGLGYLALQYAAAGPLSVYRVPIRRRAYATSGYQKNLTEKDSVIIYNNYMRTNSELTCRRYAKRLYDYDGAIDVNVRAQKTPVLILAEPSQQLTLKNLYKEFDGNAPVIYGNKNLDVKALTVLKTDAPFIADRLYDLRCNIWNEALTYLGISNISLNKKERLLVDEVNRAMGGVLANRASRVKSRQEACEKINKMFNLNIWVDFDEAAIDKAKDIIYSDIPNTEMEGDNIE